MHRLKKVSLHNAKPGMEVGKMVLTKDRKIIIGEGTVLNDIIIAGLSSWDIKEIFIKEDIPESSAVERDFTITETPGRKIFNHEYGETMTALKSTFNNVRYFKEVPLEQMKELAGHSIENMVSTTGVLNHIYLMRRQDDYTFHHSMNVAIICGILGKWMDIKGSRLQDLVLAGLLHDVGKMSIPLEILNKPGRLTEKEFEIMKQHPTHGYQMVQKTQGVSTDVMFGILQHHERMDGSGYPLGVDGSRINDFAKIIAIADIYDAMTSDKVYRGGVAPFIVIEMMLNEMFGKLDPVASFTFLDNIKDSLIGSIAILSDGREAEVIYMGHYLATRPVVFAQDGEIIDLEMRKDIRIVGTKKA